MPSYQRKIRSMPVNDRESTVYVDKLDPDMLQRAKLRACEHATDVEDARELLLTLGLIGECDELLMPTTPSAAERRYLSS